MWTRQDAVTAARTREDAPRAVERLRADAYGLVATARDGAGRAVAAQLDVARVSQLDAQTLDDEVVRILRAQTDKALAHAGPTWARAAAAVRRAWARLAARPPSSTTEHAAPTAVAGDVDNDDDDETPPLALSSRFKPELDALVRFVVWWFSTRRNVPTPGLTMQNLRFRNEAMFSEPHLKSALSLPGDGPTRAQRALHLALTVLVPYAWLKLGDVAVDERWAEREDRERWWAALEYADKTLRFATLFNLLAFLAHGKYRTLAERLLRVRLVYSKNEAVRTLSFDLVNQQLLLEGFSEMLLYLAPLVDVSAAVRWVRRLVTLVRRVSAWVLEQATARSAMVAALRADVAKRTAALGVAWSRVSPQSASASTSPSSPSPTTLQLPRARCGICNADPPVMPHRVVACGDVFCYFCAQSFAVADGNPEATRCPTCDVVVGVAGVERV